MSYFSTRRAETLSQSFDIVISKQLSADDLTAAISELLPPGLRVDIRHDVAELPDEPGAIWATILDSDDAAWPSILNVLVCRDACKLGEYPDLRIAEHLWDKFGANSLSGMYAFVGDIDLHNPYWSLGYVNGRWHLADTSGTRLMGPSTDGTIESLGDGAICLMREISVPQAK